MKFLKFFLLLFCLASYSQNIDYNAKKFVAEGYDVVSYFKNKPLKGNTNFIIEYEGAKFRFSSNENLKAFNKNPTKYIPQYGGYCAYAMSYGDKVKIDPETYEIRDEKLYLFYNSWGTNTLSKWLSENPKELKTHADKNWDEVKYKK